MTLNTEIKAPGVVYNAEIRNNGTARRVTEALFRAGYLENGLERYNRPFYEDPDYSKHDFWLFIDDGRDDIPMLDLPSPNACWLIDTHLGYEKRLEWARHFDQVFVAQKPSVAKMQEDGIEKVSWLPLACLPCVDPTAGELLRLPSERLGPGGLIKKHDVVFVGYMNNGTAKGEGNNRVDYLDAVFKAFPESWFTFNVFMEEAAIRYAKGRVGFNVSILDDLNMRFFETMSYGICLLTNRDVVGWQDLGFEEDVHFVGYQGVDECLEKIQWCLDNPIEREGIATAGHRKVRAEHTYTDRITQMFDIVGAN